MHKCIDWIVIGKLMHSKLFQVNSGFVLHCLSAIVSQQTINAIETALKLMTWQSRVRKFASKDNRSIIIHLNFITIEYDLSLSERQNFSQHKYFMCKWQSKRLLIISKFKLTLLLDFYANNKFTSFYGVNIVGCAVYIVTKCEVNSRSRLMEILV